MSTSRGILLRPMTLPLRDVRDVALAEERQQMVLAEAVEVDVLDDHHLVIIDGEQRVVEHRIDVGRVAARQEPQRLLDALRRVEQPSRDGSSPSSARSCRMMSCISYSTSRSWARSAGRTAQAPQRSRRSPPLPPLRRSRRALRRRAKISPSARRPRPSGPSGCSRIPATSSPRGSWRARATGLADTRPRPSASAASRTASPPAARRSPSNRTAPKGTSGSPPTWARWPNRSACARG